MVTFNIFYYKYFYFFPIVFLSNINLLAQGNCLIYSENSLEREACELGYRAIEFKQGSKESQLLFDKAIRLNPDYAWAYYQKSVPFFKRGLFAEGVSLINKAIELEPQNYLYYRAYWYFYNRSYNFCIRDLEEFYTNHKTSYCSTPGGELEMRLLLAIGYAHKGEYLKGIYWIENLMEYYKTQPHLKGFYDHFCFGLLYYKNNQFNLALSEFEKQLETHDEFADTYYYLGLIKEKESKDILAQEYFKNALAKMNGENGGYSLNLFTEFNIQKEDIEQKLNY